MELGLEELESSATEDEIAAEQAAARTTNVVAFTRRRPSRQPPAPLHVTARGWAGSSRLAMMLLEKLGQYRPLTRRAERYAREGVPLSLSTRADQGACAARFWYSC